MKLGLWNIDHPEVGTGSRAKERRQAEIREYLLAQDCDLYVITEANAALEINGTAAIFSEQSPYIKRNRDYRPPNRYHQVGMYAPRHTLSPQSVDEPINGLSAIYLYPHPSCPISIYGCVITIKDRWCKESELTYRDRLHQQIEAFRKLPKQRSLIVGDFNLRKGWSASKGAYQQIQECAASLDLCWPTADRNDTVQRVLHTADVSTHVWLDESVRHDQGRSNRLSDHPFMGIELNLN